MHININANANDVNGDNDGVVDVDDNDNDAVKLREVGGFHGFGEDQGFPKPFEHNLNRIFLFPKVLEQSPGRTFGFLAASGWLWF